MLSKTTINKLIKELLFPSFKKNGFKYFHEYISNYYRKSTNGITETYVLSIYQTSRIGFGHFLTISIVEDIIFEIGLPTIDLSTYDRKKDLLYTVSTNFKDSRIEESKISIEQDCTDYCQSIIEYMETEGKAFVERYSYLPNILKEMDRLVAEGKNWNGMYGKGGILTGGFDANFRGLIISKLCNDDDFENKIRWVESKVIENSKWLPYYEKIKERLKSVDPIYNV